jgi:hypothetical protein
MVGFMSTQSDSDLSGHEFRVSSLKVYKNAKTMINIKKMPISSVKLF